ncbi:hypothetical protein [Ulvibacterium marinum]|uniref:hypothetical protein n=1 Tax=Ulvibacterium marinum TaxID=2419782 RepID=UPI002494A7A0|nr:hypothetical protein [Ulvibacterium marinum]
MKKFPPFLLLVFIFLFSLSCDHAEDPFINEAEKTSEQNSSHPVTFLNAADVPNVMDRISLTSKRSKSQLSGREGSFGYVLDMEHIVGVTDSVGNKTYAFRMYLENGNENAFYNLLVTERANGEEMPIAVLEYNMEPQYFEDRANGIAREGDYQRNILYYAFSDFLQIGSAGKNTPTRHKPNNPCGEVSGDINGTGGSNAPSAPGGGDGPQTGTSPGTSNSVSGARAGGYGSVSGSATTPRQGSRGVVEVGDGCFCEKHAPKQEGDSQKGSGLAGKDDDCPKGELVIPVNEEDETPPSCESFNFVKTGGNWQEAAVTGIQFKIVLLKPTPPYAKYKYTVKLPQPVLFGAPLQPKLGGSLANKTVSYASARALNSAMRETARKYANKNVNTSVVLSYFKERIRKNFPLHIPGARANTNAVGFSVVPTKYKTSPVGYGSCD